MELYREADWKSEKHVPVIECSDVIKAGESIPTSSITREDGDSVIGNY